MPDVFEHRSHPLLSRRAFYRRFGRCAVIGGSLLIAALAIGMVGYHGFEHLPWLDAFTNAAMILSGMGSIDPLTTPAGKIFAGCYALFSGLVFIGSVGIILAPVGHRLLHKFHLEGEGEKKKAS